MGDEHDGCECVWTHEFAMQRLLAMIRQNQNHCTDTDCIDVTGRMLQSTRGGDSDAGHYTFMTMLLVFALIMYFIRPESITSLTTTKRRIGGQGPNGDSAPPPPPPAPPAVN